MIAFLILLVVALGVGSWWASVWAWEPREDDDTLGPDVPRTLRELQRRRKEVR